MFTKIGLKFTSTGIALPSGHLTSTDAHEKSCRALGKNIATGFFDITHRYTNQGEPVSDLAVQALQSALDNAQLKASDLDLIIAGSSMPEQPIPTTSVLIHRKLGLAETGIPCFDVNSTCTSFLTALEVAMGFIHMGRYKRIGIVSAELGSKGINWKDVGTAGLFGDGAAAAIVEPDPSFGSHINGFLTKTYSSGSEYCEIRAGGAKYNILTPPPSPDDYLFSMNGRAVYKHASKIIPYFINELLERSNIKLSEIDWFVPHQASPLALLHIKKILGFSDDMTTDIIQTHGNQVAASIPTALHYCLTEKAKRGDRVLVLGTGAGLNLYGMIFTY